MQLWPICHHSGQPLSGHLLIAHAVSCISSVWRFALRILFSIWRSPTQTTCMLSTLIVILVYHLINTSTFLHQIYKDQFVSPNARLALECSLIAKQTVLSTTVQLQFQDWLKMTKCWHAIGRISPCPPIHCIRGS